MNRRTNSTLLLPLMAILAVLYPVTFSSLQLTPSASSGSNTLHHAEHRRGEPPTTEDQAAAKGKGEPPHDAKKILSDFFGPGPLGEVFAGESPVRARYELDFLLVTVPDPLASRLPYLFDRNLSSIQRAAEADHFVLDRFDLPWEEELQERQAAKDGHETSADKKEIPKSHDFEKSPGLILFHDPDPEHSSDGEPRHARALLVFLVGETPTSGIHKEAMQSALDQISQFCDSLPPSNTSKPADLETGVLPNLPTPSKLACAPVKILGPSFSGSAESLDFALHTWLRSHKQSKMARFNIVSGTATAIPFDTGAPDNCLSYFRFSNGHESKFASAVVRDTLALNELLRYLEKQGNPWGVRVALLTEGNTAYGSSLSGAIRLQTPLQCSTPIVHPVLNLPFPLHISRLRSELEKARKERQQSSQQQAPSPEFPQSLPLPTEDDSGDAKDSIAPASQLDISSSELMLSNLLSTIYREQINYVGIAATDVRDVIFLAREIREHAPSTVIFSLNADLLYAHPEANPNTRGMLVVTPYPLFALNQLWMRPDPDKTGGTRIQFPDQGSEGVYNAMLTLLGQEEELLEYGSPFESWNYGEDEVPPLWMVTVGRNAFWPVAIFPRAAKESTYTRLAKPASPSSAARTNRGIVPQFTHAVLILWGLFCLLPGLIFLAHDAERWLGWEFVKGVARWLRSRVTVTQLFALEGVEAKSLHLFGGSATLSIYAVAVAAYFVSAIARQEPSRKLFLSAMLLILFVGATACFSLAFDVIRHAWRPSDRDIKCKAGVRGGRLWVVIPALIASGLFWLLAVCLSGYWIYLHILDRGNGIITGLRAVNLNNGVSALPPLFFISLAAAFWVLSSIRRLNLNEEISLVSPPSTEGSTQSATQYDENSIFFYSDEYSFRGLRVLERRARDLIACSSLQFPCGSRAAVFLTLSLTLFWGGYLFFYRLVYAFEAKFFYWLLGSTFLLVYAAVLTNVLRLFFLWRAVRALLQRLDRHPMRDAFSRFHRAHRTMPRMSLATAPTPLTALGFSVAQAGNLVGSLQELPVTRNEEIAKILEAGKEKVRRAESCFANALEEEALGRYQPSLNGQKEAQIALNSFTRIVEGVLELSWKSSISVRKRESAKGIPELLWQWFVSNPKPPQNLEEVRKVITNQGEEFIVSRTVHFLAYIFPQLTNLATYSLICLFLMLLAISSYPLQPRNPFFFFNWFVILVFIGVGVYIAVQMNRDVVLSGLNGTKPGEIHWDTEFIGRIVFFIVLPVLGLLGIQFPETLGQFLRWLAPAGSGHP